MFCSQCGTAAESVATSCGSCGFTFSAAPPRGAAAAERITAASRDMFRAVKLLLLDPVGSIGTAYDALSPKQALDVGIALAALFIVSCLVAIRLIVSTAARFGAGFFFSIGFKQILTTVLVSAVPLISIVAIFYALQMIAKRENDYRRAVFAGPAALVPVAIFNIVAGIVGAANGEVIALVALFALCYTILLIYAGCRDVLKVPSAGSAGAVPLVLLATAWLTKIILVAMM